MGIAARSGLYMDITLAPTVWKLLVEEQPVAADLESVNFIEAAFIKKMREATPETFVYEFGELDFTTQSSGGSMVELHSSGERDVVTWENRERFIDELVRYRLTEMTTVVAAVRRGLCTQIPQIALAMMRWDDLEKRVCGNPMVDVALLQSATEYEGYSESDNVVKWLWEILSEFSQEQRKAYLKFVWGRTRLPLTKAQFPKRMKITKLEK